MHCFVDHTSRRYPVQDSGAAAGGFSEQFSFGHALLFPSGLLFLPEMPLRLRMLGEKHGKGGPSARLACNENATSVPFDDGLYRCQAEPEALSCPNRGFAMEKVEDAREQELLFLPGGRLIYRVITSLVERGRLEIGSSARWNSKEEKGCDEQ